MNRIELLASLTKGAKILVDCGCDHGYVSKMALEKYDVSYAYLLEVAQGPLDNAKKTIAAASLNDKASFLLSDGLKEFDKDADTLVIAGMGGLLINKILNDSIDKLLKFKRIILQPNTDVDKVRGYIIGKHFVFDEEYLINDDGHNYTIIVGHFDLERKMKYDLLDMKYGPILRKEKSPLFLEINEKRKEQLKQYLSKASDDASKSRLTIELAFLKMLDEMKD